MNSYQEIFDQSLLMHSHGVSTNSILTYIAAESEKLIGKGCVVSILLLDEEGLLRNGASPGLPSDYLKAIDGIKPNPNLGTCAAAAATGEIIVTKSFLDDSKWSELKHLPLSIGYTGAWSVPIKDNSNITLGTMGVYQKNTNDPVAEDKEGIILLSKAVSHVLTYQEV